MSALRPTASAATAAGPASAGGVTGTVAYTNANDTSAASGTTTVVGTLSTTNANDSCAASGSVGGGVSGSVAYTNANDTSAASGTTTVVGTLARTNANDTAAASGFAGIVSGTVAYTNANDTAQASGTAAGSESGFQGTNGAFFPLKANKKRETAEEKRLRRIAQGIEKPEDPTPLPVPKVPTPKRPSDLSALKQDKGATEFVAQLRAQQATEKALKLAEQEEEDIVFIAALLSL